MRGLGYPNEWRDREIREIPLSLWEKLRMQPTPLTADPKELERFESIQPRFEMLTRQWREEREAGRQAQRQHTQENAIDAEVERLQALEQAEKLTKLRKQAKKNLGFTEEK